jgi:hypothetical protein
MEVTPDACASGVDRDLSKLVSVRVPNACSKHGLEARPDATRLDRIIDEVKRLRLTNRNNRESGHLLLLC